MSNEIKIQGINAIIAIDYELDENGTFKFRELVNKLKNLSESNIERIIIDFKYVNIICSSVLGKLMILYIMYNDKNIKIVLKNLKHSLIELCSSLKMNDLFILE